ALSPLRLLTQIITLQLLYYLCVTALLLFTALTAGRPFSWDLLLGWRSVRGDTARGWTVGGCWLGGAVCGTILIILIIARSKLVPDFALTLHSIHLLLTCLYSRGVPRNGLWWGLQAVSAGLMVGGGVWGCRWRELRPIAFGSG
ncbi:integral membrane protein S linking to the trans Golgi network-domain-containing protein, partial [Usnea florida]